MKRKIKPIKKEIDREIKLVKKERELEFQNRKLEYAKTFNTIMVAAFTLFAGVLWKESIIYLWVRWTILDPIENNL